MAFSEAQVKRLEAKLDSKHVRTRKVQETTLAYVEGWHVIAEANRIFGYDAWDRRTLASSCVWTGASGQFYSAAYTAKVRVSVRAGDIIIVREGSGSGEARAPTPGQAHDLALKGAETDATKRALATFGNPFGLALYDSEQAGVRKPRNGSGTSTQTTPEGPWVLRSSTGVSLASFEVATTFAEALRKALGDAEDIERLFAIWEQNIETVRAINKHLRQDRLPRSGLAQQLVAHLKACAIALAKKERIGAWAARNDTSSEPHPDEDRSRPKIDKSVLTLSEPKRLRSREHLRFVAQRPCLVCGRSPSHAHHIRYARGSPPPTSGLGPTMQKEVVADGATEGDE